MTPPSEDETTASPPPEAKDNAQTGAQISVTLIIAGTLDDFAQDAFKANLAAQLDGISPADIELKVTAASLRVTAIITTRDESVGSSALNTLNSLAESTETLSAALGVAVESVEDAPALALVNSAQTTNDGSQGADTLGGMIAAIGGGGAAVLMAVILCALYRFRRALKKRRALEGVDAVSIDINVESANVSDGERSNAQEYAKSRDGVMRAGATCTASMSSSDGSVASSSSGVRKQRALQLMSQWEFDSGLIVWEEELGAGSFGKVYRVQYSGETLAAKRMDFVLTRETRAEVEELIAREFRALQKVTHANVVELLGVVVDHPDWICIMMEMADCGSLRQMLDRSPADIVGKPPVQTNLAFDVASALAYCHGLTPKPLLHHDIKSANVLLFSQDESGAARLTAKISDFGLAVGVSGTSTAAMTAATKTHATGGTFAYRAPETFSGIYTKASEVYSYAMVLYELLTAERPWYRDPEGRPYMDANVLNLVVNKGKRPELPGTTASPTRSRTLAALMRRCWAQEPKKRPTFEMVIAQLRPQLTRVPSSGKRKIALALEEMRSLKESMGGLHEKVARVDDNVNRVHSGVSRLSVQLDAVEERLAHELREGNAAILEQMRLLHGSLLPEIQCVVEQQTLELSAMQQVARSSDGERGGVLSWLFASKQQEEEHVLQVQRSVKAAIDMADARLRASAESVAAKNAAAASSASVSASAEILKKLDEMQSALGERDSGGNIRGDALLSKLEDISAFMSQMDGRMSQMRLEADDRAKEQTRQLALVHKKLDVLLTGSNEQVFHHFILVPKPQKGYLGRTLDALKPRFWFAKPMLLIPLYRSPSGELKRAPIKMKSGGFEVPKPYEFVKTHPRAVQLAMLATQAGIKIGAAQLGVAIPAESLNMLSSVTDALLTDTLQLAIESMASNRSLTNSIQYVAATAEPDPIDEYIANEAATAPPADVLERLSSSEGYKAASRNEYALLRGWLDNLHPGWQARCGLEPRVNAQTGCVEWLPAGE